MDIRRRSVIREIIWIGVILFCAGLIGFSIFGRHGWLQLREKETRLEQLQSEIRRLEQENKALKVRIEKLQSDPALLEEEIRKKLLYTKPGETIYQVTEPKDRR
jgi:cell division protein FtsB